MYIEITAEEAGRLAKRARARAAALFHAKQTGEIGHIRAYWVDGNCYAQAFDSFDSLVVDTGDGVAVR